MDKRDDCNHADVLVCREQNIRNSVLEVIDDFLERACFNKHFFRQQYLRRLIFSTFFFIACSYINALATLVSTHRNPYIRIFDLQGNPLENYTIPDVGHDLWALILIKLGHHTDFIDQHSLPDKLVLSLGQATFFLVLCHPRRFLILRRVCMIFGLLLLMRAVSVSVTVLPDASPVCYAQFTSTAGDFRQEPLFPSVFGKAAIFLISPTSLVTCGDMMFSGHTTCLMMFALTFRKYFRAKHLQTKVLFRSIEVTEEFLTPIRRGIYVYCAFGCSIIIGSKLHYTLDVIAAIFLSFWAYRSYHIWASTDAFKRQLRLLAWLEDDSVLNLDNSTYERAKRD